MRLRTTEVRALQAEEAAGRVGGTTVVTNDQHHAGDKSIKLITMITICVIFLMLLFVYRSIVTVLIVLVMMFIAPEVAKSPS